MRLARLLSQLLRDREPDLADAHHAVAQVVQVLVLSPVTGSKKRGLTEALRTG